MSKIVLRYFTNLTGQPVFVGGKENGRKESAIFRVASLKLVLASIPSGKYIFDPETIIMTGQISVHPLTQKSKKDK